MGKYTLNLEQYKQLKKVIKLINEIGIEANIYHDGNRERLTIGNYLDIPTDIINNYNIDYFNDKRYQCETNNVYIRMYIIMNWMLKNAKEENLRLVQENTILNNLLNGELHNEIFKKCEELFKIVELLDKIISEDGKMNNSDLNSL